MTNADLIKPHAPVLGADGRQIGVVDHLEGTDLIKLARDAEGVHHYIPVTWVSSVDDRVHLDRSAEQAVTEWSKAFPTDARSPASS
jgi:hypothetical protein